MKKILKVTKQDNIHVIKFVIHSKVDFQKYKKEIYYIKVSTDTINSMVSHITTERYQQYTPPPNPHRFKNLIDIQLINVISPDPEEKTLTPGCQKCFTPIPGSYLRYHPHQEFFAYLYNSGKISVTV